MTAMEKINKIAERPLSEDEVYIFSIVLCNNDLEIYYECFSDKALKILAKEYIGKSALIDFHLGESNKDVCIFDTAIITDNTQRTQIGKPLKYVKANVYAIRNDRTARFISEMENGIEKEGSVVCRAVYKCSICGKKKSHCTHIKGKIYNNKMCYVILDKVTEVYNCCILNK